MTSESINVTFIISLVLLFVKFYQQTTLKVVFANYLRFIKPYHPTVKSAVVNGTRKHFEVTNMYKLFLS